MYMAVYLTLMWNVALTYFLFVAIISSLKEIFIQVTTSLIPLTEDPLALSRRHQPFSVVLVWPSDPLRRLHYNAQHGTPGVH